MLDISSLPVFVAEVTVQNFRFLFLVQLLASAAVLEGIEVFVVVAATPFFVANVIRAGIAPRVGGFFILLASVVVIINSGFLF